jgi:hypothetical protein
MTRLSRILALAALFFLVLELSCRLEDWVRYRTPIFSRFRSQSDLLVHDLDGVHGRPNSRYQKWMMNSLGMRGPAADSEPQPGVMRVVTAGASETFGLYESDRHEFPRQLEDSLNLRLATHACGPFHRAEVLNAALPGMSLPTVEQDVRLRLARLHPAVVVYYPTPVQYLEDRLPTAAPPTRAAATEPPLRDALRPRSLDRVRTQIKLLLPDAVQSWIRERQTRDARVGHPPGWALTSMPQANLTAFEHDLRVLVGSVRQIGATPVLGTHANAFVGPGPHDQTRLTAWQKFYPRAAGDLLVDFDSAGSVAVARVAADSSVPLADIARALAGRRADTFADFSHFTDAGAAVVAGTVSRSILSADCPVRMTDKQPALLPVFGLSGTRTGYLD